MRCGYSAFIHMIVSGINNSYTETFPFRYQSEYEVTRTESWLVYTVNGKRILRQQDSSPDTGSSVLGLAILRLQGNKTIRP
jgi:hypothetical protein